MDLSKLRTFVAVADDGAVGRASKRRHLSQPAVTRQIQGLEAELGMRLLERAGRGVRLTPAGADLLSRARAVVYAADDMMLRARTLRGGDAGPIRFGATPPMIESVLAGFLPVFRKAHPGIDLTIVEDGGEALTERLAAGDVDVAYVPAGDERFTGPLLYPVHVVAVTAKRDAPATGTLELSRLADRPVMLMQRGFGSRQQLEAASAEARIKLHVVYESSSHSTVIALAAAGHGIGILPSALAEPPRDVCFTPIVHDGRAVGHWTMLAWDPRRPAMPHVAAFVGELAGYARAVQPGRKVVADAPAIPRPEQPPVPARPRAFRNSR